MATPAGAASSIERSPASTRSLIARETGSSLRPSSSATLRTVAPPPTATTVVQRAWSTLTSVRGRSLRSVTHASSDGTTDSMSRHSWSKASDWSSKLSTSAGALGASCTASASNVKAPSSKRRSSKRASTRSIACGACVASSAQTPPDSTHTLPVPRPPVMRRRPVFFVAARRRSTSARAKVSRVP